MPVTWWYTPTYSTSALSTSAERKRAAYLLLHISDGLLDQVDEVGRAELAEGVERLGAGLDCGMQLLLEDPTAVQSASGSMVKEEANCSSSLMLVGRRAGVDVIGATW